MIKYHIEQAIANVKSEKKQQIEAVTEKITLWRKYVRNGIKLYELLGGQESLLTKNIDQTKSIFTPLAYKNKLIQE